MRPMTELLVLLFLFPLLLYLSIFGPNNTWKGEEHMHK
jgi:hypothetical protein